MWKENKGIKFSSQKLNKLKGKSNESIDIIAEMARIEK